MSRRSASSAADQRRGRPNAPLFGDVTVFSRHGRRTRYRGDVPRPRRDRGPRVPLEPEAVPVAVQGGRCPRQPRGNAEETGRGPLPTGPTDRLREGPGDCPPEATAGLGGPQGSRKGPRVGVG